MTNPERQEPAWVDAVQYTETDVQLKRIADALVALAALDAVPAPDREKVAEAIRQTPAAASSEEMADAAIAAMRSGAPPEDDG